MMHTSLLDRRSFIAGAAALSATPWLAQAASLRADGKTILLISGWQTENIGDIAHTTGVLRLLEDQLPHHRVILWGKAMERGVAEMLQRRFPKVDIVRGTLDPEKGAADPKLARAIDQADFLLHGSGPSLVAQREVAAWLQFTKKPYGAFGITTQSPSDATREILAQASFIFTRETTSLEHLKKAGITKPHQAFAPDGTFVIDVTDEKRARTFLKAHDLEEGKFICVIPRLRVTPYYQFKPWVKWTEERIRSVTELNEKWAEPDHAKAREAIVRWVRETGNKVLLCPEMTYQLDILQELLFDPLPDDVKPKVVRRTDYWLPDEAGSVYRRARAVVSFECHSPIIAFAHGTPAMYLRQPQDTIKGQMWYDIGVPEWVFEIEETKGTEIADRLMAIHENWDDAQDYLNKAVSLVNSRYKAALKVMDETLASL